jgi:hypothetical protein
MRAFSKRDHSRRWETQDHKHLKYNLQKNTLGKNWSGRRLGSARALKKKQLRVRFYFCNNEYLYSLNSFIDDEDEEMIQ